MDWIGWNGWFCPNTISIVFGDFLQIILNLHRFKHITCYEFYEYDIFYVFDDEYDVFHLHQVQQKVVKVFLLVVTPVVLMSPFYQ